MALQGYTLPPPYNGLDVVSPIDQMDPASALELVNVFPSASAPAVRLGYVNFIDPALSDSVTFLAAYNRTNGTSELIAATDTTLDSISSAGVVTSLTGTTTPTSGEWQTVTFAGRIYLCNGVNNTQVYNGTTIADVTFTGVGIDDLINVCVYKERLYFVEANTTKVWYGGLQVTGTGGAPALTSFDFGFVFSRGGYLVGIGSYSNSNNVAAQDYFYACSSEGEIVFYSGTYAGDPTTWGLVAKFYIGKPLGYRAFVRVNNDVWIITRQGIVPVSALFQSDPESALQSLSRKVNPLISAAANSFPFDHQWSGFFWPQGRRVYISIPSTGGACYFLVYSLDLKSWTTFRLYSDSHALSSCLYLDLPFYGADSGMVYKGETGLCDAFDGTNGESINYDIRTAFNYFDSRGNYKTFKDIRPLLETKKGISLRLGIDTDFQRQSTLPAISTAPGAFTSWSTTGGPSSSGYVPWGSAWSSPTSYVFDRFATKGQGHCGAIRCSGSIKNATLKFLAFEVRFDLGGQV